MTGACVLDPRFFVIACCLLTRLQIDPRSVPEVDSLTQQPVCGSVSQSSRPPLAEVCHVAVASAQRMCVAAQVTLGSACSRRRCLLVEALWRERGRTTINGGILLENSWKIAHPVVLAWTQIKNFLIASRQPICSRTWANVLTCILAAQAFGLGVGPALFGRPGFKVCQTEGKRVGRDWMSSQESLRWGELKLSVRWREARPS